MLLLLEAGALKLPTFGRGLALPWGRRRGGNGDAGSAQGVLGGPEPGSWAAV